MRYFYFVIQSEFGDMVKTAPVERNDYMICTLIISRPIVS